MAHDLAKIQRLAKEMSELMDQLPAFSRPEFKKLEETFLSHFKGVMNDVTTKQIGAAANSTALKNQVEEIKQWYEKKMQAIRLVVTVCVAQHKLALPQLLTQDETEEFTRLLDLAKDKLAVQKYVEEIKDLCVSVDGGIFAQQNHRLPVFFPFDIKFALQDPEDGSPYKLLLGAVPCVYAEFEHDDQSTFVVTQLASQVPYNTQLYMPKLMCHLKNGTKVRKKKLESPC